MIERVVEAAASSHAEWSLPIAQQQAARIVENGRSQYYAQAARWLELMGQAASAAGREAEWRAHVDGLIAVHKRKRSLVPLLERVRAGR